MKRKSARNFYLMAIVFALFQKGSGPEEVIDEASQLGVEDTRFSRIRCPLCHWQPDEWSSWHCGDCDYPEYFYNACGMEWNTFTTRGLCPGCLHQWRWTSCLRCHDWSLHEDWYTKEDD